MHIDIDSLLDSIDGWDLSVSVAGNQFIVDPPPRASRELLEKILSGDSITDADRPELEKLIGPLIRESSVDLANWGFSQLVGVATAIAVKAKEIYIAHSRGICRAVALAVRTPQSPKSPAAAIPDAPGVGQAAVSPAAPHRAGEAAAMIHDVPASNQAKTVASAPQLGPAAARKYLEEDIRLRTGVAVPPGTSDTDLIAAFHNSFKATLQPAQPVMSASEQKA